MATLRKAIAAAIKDVQRDELYFYNDNRCFEFIKANPNNDDPLIISEKISAMNNGLMDVHYLSQMAEHIHSLEPDDALNAGDLSIVSKIAGMDPDDPWKFRYLASNYCNFHRPEIYPVQSKCSEDLTLLYVRDQENEDDLSDNLDSYPDFAKATESMRRTFDIGTLNYYEFEKFLWLKASQIRKYFTDSGYRNSFE